MARNNLIVPSGYVRIGDQAKAAPINAVVRNIDELLDIPIRATAGPTVFLRDIGSVQDTMDILAGYAMVNGRRSVYLPVIKRADASTLDVVNEVRNALPRFRALVPEDITVNFEFDQSQYVTSAIRSLATEGILGAILTGLAVLLFLSDFRGAAIVVTTIPLALLAAVLGLWIAGQTINLMTLGGLTLAIGILVDESTVAIENMHTHLTREKNKALAILRAGSEVAVPQFLAMLCVAAVFTPALFMVGPGRALFVPLALAVAFAMAASYALARTYVPVLATWLLRAGHAAESDRRSTFVRVRDRYSRIMTELLRFRWAVVGAYALIAVAGIYLLGMRMGTGDFPQRRHGPVADAAQGRSRNARRADRSDRAAGARCTSPPKSARTMSQGSIGYVGIQPTSFPINTILLWTSGPHEAVLRVALNPASGVATETLKERLRTKLPDIAPGATIAFEPADIISQVMSFGASTPIEIAILGPDFAASRKFAGRRQGEDGRCSHSPGRAVRDSCSSTRAWISELTGSVRGSSGSRLQEVGQALVAATSSTRFIQPNYWAAPNTGVFVPSPGRSPTISYQFDRERPSDTRSTGRYAVSARRRCRDSDRRHDNRTVRSL